MPTPELEAVVQTLLMTRDDFSSGDVQQRAGISRQAAHLQLRTLVKAGRLEPFGAGPARRYRLPDAATRRLSFPRAGLRAADVWTLVEQRTPAVAALAPAPKALARYAVLQLVDNVIDHAGATKLELDVHPGEPLRFTLLDDGAGLFERLRVGLGAATVLEAAQALGKPNLPSGGPGHTGEGLFFVMKAVDLLELEGNGLKFVADPARADTALLRVPVRPGTRATFAIRTDRTVPLDDLFAGWTEAFRISRAQLRVKLYELGVRFVSRSEARRLLAGMETIRELVLDFTGVEGVGQAFADEVFRVWAPAHPDVRLTAIGMNDVVAAAAGLRTGP